MSKGFSGGVLGCEGSGGVVAVPAPGWYPDHQDRSLVRWWDGAQWTAHTAPARPLPAPPTPVSPWAAGTTAGPQARISERERDPYAEASRLGHAADHVTLRERDELRAEIGWLREEVPRLRGERQQLLAYLGTLRAEVEQLTGQRVQLLAMQSDLAQLEMRRDLMTAAVSETERQMAPLRAEYAQLSARLVETREMAILQEVGVYQYRHPLDDAVAYKARLAGVQARIKDAVKAEAAVHGSASWTVNNSVQEGTRMAREFSKLMLRDRKSVV